MICEKGERKKGIQIWTLVLETKWSKIEPPCLWCPVVIIFKGLLNRYRIVKTKCLHSVHTIYKRTMCFYFLIMDKVKVDLKELGHNL